MNTAKTIKALDIVAGDKLSLWGDAVVVEQVSRCNRAYPLYEGQPALVQVKLRFIDKYSGLVKDMWFDPYCDKFERLEQAAA